MSEEYIKLKERLLKYSKWNGECLESTYKARSQSGYALVKFRRSTKGAHRISWLVHKGEIPNGMWVLHKCDNPLCINPEHLFLGTPKNNTEDMMRKGRENFKGAEKYSGWVALEAVENRRNGLKYKQIAKKMSLNISTISSMFRRDVIKNLVEGFYGVPKYSKEIKDEAFRLRNSGVKCKDIQKMLSIPKRSLTRIFKEVDTIANIS